MWPLPGLETTPVTRRSQLHELVLLRLTAQALVTNIQRLSDEMGVERSSLSRSLHALHKDSLVTRRGRTWVLTAIGTALAADLRAKLPQKIEAARRKRDRAERLLDRLERLKGETRDPLV